MRVVSYWALAITRFQQEERAASHVERQGFAYWLPRMVEWTMKGREKRVLMFPGYLFFKVTSRQDWSLVCSTKGISSVVLSDDKPARVRGDEMKYLMSLEDDRGLVNLPARFADGDDVRIAEGPYRGICGVVQGVPEAGRLRVLWSMLGKEVGFCVGEGSLEPAPA